MHELLGSRDVLLLLGIGQLAAGTRLLVLSLAWWGEAARARQHASTGGRIELVG